MTTSQPSTPQRDDKVVLARVLGVLCELGGRWGSRPSSSAAHRGAGFLRAWPALETEGHQAYSSTPVKETALYLPTEWAGSGGGFPGSGCHCLQK